MLAGGKWLGLLCEGTIRKNCLTNLVFGAVGFGFAPDFCLFCCVAADAFYTGGWRGDGVGAVGSGCVRCASDFCVAGFGVLSGVLGIVASVVLCRALGFGAVCFRVRNFAVLVLGVAFASDFCVSAAGGGGFYFGCRVGVYVGDFSTVFPSDFWDSASDFGFGWWVGSVGLGVASGLGLGCATLGWVCLAGKR